jgi:uncharacterized protein YqhQ
LPGGHCGDDDGGVGDHGVIDLLDRADAERALPRLGGMARANGVVIVSERFWAFAAVDGSVREGEMPGTATAFRHVPLLRGLARLSGSLAPLFRGGGVAGRRERWVLALALLAPFALFLVPHDVSAVIGVVTTLVLVAWLFRGRTLALHGAEHRAIAATEERSLRRAWEGTVLPTRFSTRCGTNFSALVLPVSIGFDRLWPLPALPFAPLLVALLALALTMELWVAIQGAPRTIARVFLAPGLALQRVTTREPRLDETRVALTAVASVLRRELSNG